MWSCSSSLAQSWPLFATPWITARQASLFTPTPGVQSNSCPSSWWCHPAISSSVVPFSSLPQSFPASGSFPMSQLFSWGGHSIGVSALASFLPMNTWLIPFRMDWLISLQGSCIEYVKIRKRRSQRALSPGTYQVHPPCWWSGTFQQRWIRKTAHEVREKLRESQGHLPQIFTMRTSLSSWK